MASRLRAPDGTKEASSTQSRSRLGVMRVAVVAEDLRPPLDEGAKKSTFNLIRALRDNGANVLVFSRSENPLLADAHSLPRNKLLLGPAFARAMRGQSPDAILYVPASSGTLGAFVRAAMIKLQASGTPLALLSLQYSKPPAAARFLGLYRYADAVFSQSEASTQALRSVGCKTFLLPGAVDCSTFHPASADEKRLLRAKYGFGSNDRIILHIGHCKRNRNVMALARFASLGLKPVLVASTSTVFDPVLQAELEQAGVRVITGFVEAVQHYYQMADCYLFPVYQADSAIDAPLSVLEAMACNLPVVTTRFGALPRLFQPGSGLYYYDSDEEMDCLVKQALAEPDCRTMDKVSGNSWEQAASVIVEVLKESTRL